MKRMDLLCLLFLLVISTELGSSVLANGDHSTEGEHSTKTPMANYLVGVILVSAVVIAFSMVIYNYQPDPKIISSKIIGWTAFITLILNAGYIYLNFVR